MVPAARTEFIDQQTRASIRSINPFGARFRQTNEFGMKMNR